MNTSRQRHVGKSKAARVEYLRSIKNRDYEPTVKEKEPFDFSDSRLAAHPDTIPIERRPRSTGDWLSDHFQENWVKWVFSLIGLVIVYFVFTFSKEQGKIESKIEATQNGVEKTSNQLHKINEDLHNIELNVKENSVKISNLENREKK